MGKSAQELGSALFFVLVLMLAVGCAKYVAI